MIKKLKIQNFKILKYLELDIKPLNLLMGLNGMGKSTLIQSFLLLRQSIALSNGRLSLNDQLVRVGKGKDAMYQYNQNEDMKIEINFSDNDPLSWCFKYNPDSDYLETKNNYAFDKLITYPLFNNNFQFLSAARLGPQVDYPTSYKEVITDRQLGVDGCYVIHYLNAFGSERVSYESLLHSKAKSNTLLHQVDAWLGEIAPGIKLNITEIPGIEKVILDFQFETGSLYTNRFRPSNVGFGISYVLPIIVTLLSFQPGKLILIENPESHIHPRGQVELGKLISLAARNGAQLIVETHSDHIVNGIRVGVKENLINKENVGLFYFEKVISNEEQFSKTTHIRIDKNGELSEYPKDFLDEWSNQLFKLM